MHSSGDFSRFSQIHVKHQCTVNAWRRAHFGAAQACEAASVLKQSTRFVYSEFLKTHLLYETTSYKTSASSLLAHTLRWGYSLFRPPEFRTGTLRRGNCMTEFSVSEDRNSIGKILLWAVLLALALFALGVLVIVPLPWKEQGILGAALMAMALLLNWSSRAATSTMALMMISL